MNEKPNYEDEDGKGISFKDFKTQVMEEASEEFEKMLGEATIAGQVAVVLTRAGFPNVVVSSKDRAIQIDIPLADVGKTHRYTLTVDRVN